MNKLNIAIVGAGLGGLTAAASLQSLGFKVRIYEQAEQLGEIGAGISLPPNSTRILEHLGLGGQFRQHPRTNHCQTLQNR